MGACGVYVTVLLSTTARVGVEKRFGDNERRNEMAVVDGAKSEDVVEATIVAVYDVPVIVVAAIGVAVRVVVASNMGREALTAVDGEGEGERVDWRVFAEAVAEVPAVADLARGGV